jgi:ADP-ribose pyrophosphatase YjhB (NUDIX family)
MVAANMNLVYGGIFVSPNQKILLVKGKLSGKWSFPKGHPKEGETEFECATREIFEETGLKMPSTFERILNLATGIYYLIRSPEHKCEINDNNEISEIAWMNLAELKNVKVNVDVNTFIREYKFLFQTPTQSIGAKIHPRILLL